MTECRIPYFRRAAIFATLTLSLTLSDAEATIKQPNFSIPAGATWTGVNGSEATGRCMLLFTYLRTKALVHCTIEGGAPLTSIQLWVDGFDVPVFATPVFGRGPYTFTIEPLPTVVVRALPTGALRIDGHTVAGLETSGTFQPATDAVFFSVFMYAGQVVPPSSTSAIGVCIVTVLGVPSFLGVDCVHNVPNPQSFTFHNGPAFETGEVLLDFSAVLGDPNPDDTDDPNPDDTDDPNPDDTGDPNPDDTGDPNPDDTGGIYLTNPGDSNVADAGNRNPTIWRPIDDELRVTMAAERTYLRMVGGGESNIIRGQINGCRTSDSSACAFGRFMVQASGEPTDQSAPRLPATAENLASSFDSVIVDERQFAKTETFLFSLTANRDQSLLVEITDGCSSGRGFILNVVGTDFESYQYFTTFTDLLLGYQDVIAIGSGLRFDRRQAFYFACPPQTQQ